MQLLSELSEVLGFELYQHLNTEMEIPELSDPQAQGDLYVLPATSEFGIKAPAGFDKTTVVPENGVALIAATGNGGHEHRLFASEPGTATLSYISGLGTLDSNGNLRQDIAWLSCSAPAFVLHKEHGATGIAPGTYLFRRQKEMAEEQRLVAD